MTSEVAADSTVLIFLGTLRRLDAVRTHYDRIVVPPAVYEEVVEDGKAVGAKDAPLVERAVDAGWIEVVDVDLDPAIESFGLEAGETAVHSLTLSRDHDEVLADEEGVREVARLHDVVPRGTIWFLFAEVRRGDLSFDGFLAELETLLESGFYLDEAIYLEAVRTARRLSEE